MADFWPPPNTTFPWKKNEVPILRSKNVHPWRIRQMIATRCSRQSSKVLVDYQDYH